MASAFLRNSSRLRQIFCSFNSQLSSSNLHHYKSIHNSTLIGDNQYKLAHAFSLNRRFLCTGTRNPNVNQSTSSNAEIMPSSGSTEGNSGNKNDGGQSSGGSQNTSQQGKSVRGGPVSWVSFFLLLCTGAGLVYYYDKEKRRHIEG
ncbi:hypothetical protein CASFOL_018092 [Castilleja foliolosa]|uniref:Uncharacterized protein n=1 Tax=Castilleja foliolosa TaxID=1961234 RepID=A0ABD3DA92_9LAMI